jgi:hypothetical protein
MSGIRRLVFYPCYQFPLFGVLLVVENLPQKLSGKILVGAEEFMKS